MHQSDVELTISRFSKIERSLVTDLGATEKNGSSRTSFIDRLSEVEHLFTTASIQRLRSIASLRNKLVHGDITSLPDREQFIKDCDMVDMAIDLAKEKRDSVPGGRNTVNSSAGAASELRRKPIGPVQRIPGAIGFLVAIVVLFLVFSFFSKLNNSATEQAGIGTGESVQVKVTDKGIHNDLVGKFLFCKVKFENLTDKKITGIRGKLEVIDSKGSVLHSFSVYFDSKYDTEIHAKSSFVKLIGSSITDEYSKFNEKDRLYKSIPLDSLKCTWQPQQIVYEDGTETAR